MPHAPRRLWPRFGRFSYPWLILFAAVIVVGGVVYLPRLYRMALLGSGYMAQQLCAGVFISSRPFEDVMAQDLTGPGLEPLRLFTPTVDEDAKDVSAAVFGFREGFGCTLIHDTSASALRKETAGLFSPTSPPKAGAEWPEGTCVTQRPWPNGMDGKAASLAIEEIFAKGDPERPRASRALVVVYQGRIVAER